MDYGVAAGGGVELAVSDGLSLGLDLVYSTGRSRIEDDPDAQKNQRLTRGRATGGPGCRDPGRVRARGLSAATSGLRGGRSRRP